MYKRQVVGQTSFTTNVFPGDTPTAASLRGPNGVWIQNGQLFVADTQNDRVLIYNSIPTSNGAAADIVLGQPNMTTYVQVNIADQTTSAASNNLLTPVSVTSDGTDVYKRQGLRGEGAVQRLRQDLRRSQPDIIPAVFDHLCRQGSRQCRMLAAAVNGGLYVAHLSDRHDGTCLLYTSRCV